MTSGKQHKTRLELESNNASFDELNRRRIQLHGRCLSEQYPKLSRVKLMLKKSANGEQYRLIACISIHGSHHQPALTVETRGCCLAQVIDRIFKRLQQRLAKMAGVQPSLKLTPGYAIAAAMKWCDS